MARVDALDLTFEQLSLGQSASFTAAFDDAQLEAFMALCGDRNPLHADADYAKADGFPDRVLHGLLTSSLYSTLVGMHLPGRRAILRGIQTTFHAPAHPGERLEVSGIVALLHREFRLVELKAQITNGKGTIISRAKLSVGLRDR